MQLDSDRRHLRLSSRELALVVALAADAAAPLQGRPETSRAHAELERAGAVRDGLLVAWVADIGQAIARPQGQLLVETFVGGAMVPVRVWIGRDAAALARERNELDVEVARVERSLVLFALVRVLDLGPRPVPPQREPIETDSGVLARLDASTRTGTDPAGGAQTGDEAGDEATVRLTRLLAARRLAWRAQALGRGAGAEVLMVVDAGDEGLWTSRPGPGGRTLLELTSYPAVLERLRALLASELTGA